MKTNAKVVSIRSQAGKLHENFDHFKYSLRGKKKKNWR